MNNITYKDSYLNTEINVNIQNLNGLTINVGNRVSLELLLVICFISLEYARFFYFHLSNRSRK